MYAKVVTFHIKPGKRDEVSRLFHDFVVPGARKHKGFKGGLLLTDPNTGKGTSIGFWETEADILASESSGFYREWVTKLSAHFSAQPSRDIYEVSNLVNFSLG
ncbi:MAG TPA: antibiotic biosynthesis monooxygenase family protein [Nitrospirota bacterium]|nr:antibiotic biosynthesis monooxygenase family protein [Nitrospirota bacterium]